jgi:broad specificity phosphatase PhoE
MSDAHFQIGVVHGLADAPLYQWQDPVYQDRYDAGYALGQWERITRAARPDGAESWEAFEARVRQRWRVQKAR